MSPVKKSFGMLATPVATGIPGPKGDKGDRGERGRKGADGLPGADGPQGPSGAVGGVVSVVAAENIPAFLAVTSLGARGDSSDSSHFGKIVGLTKTDAASGFSVDVCQIGEIQNLSWSWTAGQEIFLNGNSLSSASPVSGFVQKVGVAKNSTTVIVEVATPVLL